jgi:cyanophycinase
MKKAAILAAGLFCITLALKAQKASSVPKGNLFIIGGGSRGEALMKTMISTAKLQPNSYIVVLPMSGAEPDTSFYYFKKDIEKLCNNTVANLNFTPEKVNNKQWLDSVEHASLIFITGGDQVRFMKIVLHTPVYNAIHAAYRNGATIAGTSAGAAVMSREMITGNQLQGDSTYTETFKKIVSGNIEIQEGLGLLDSAIIDQHFIKRSRYNRLISALAKYPAYPCIGIDESTAIIVQGKKITITGEGQVVVMSKPEGLAINAKGQIKWKDVKMQLLTEDDVFWLK